MFVTLYGCDRRAKYTILQSTNNPLVKDVGVRIILKKDITEKICQHNTFEVNKDYEKDPAVSLPT